MSKRLIRLIALGFATIFAGLVLAIDVPFDLVDRAVIESRLKSFSRNDTERETILKKLFADSGCAGHISEQPVKHVSQPNLICTLPGQTESVIIVGAHFDHVQEGDGVVDNWSGASLLPSLYQSLNRIPRRHTFLFIAFAGEEQGLVGSEWYVNHMSKEDVDRTEAMINMDSLGLGPTEAWLSHSDPNLAGLLSWASKTLKIPLRAMNVEAVGSSDSEEFARRKIPRLTVHSVTQTTLAVLHNSRDNLRAIHMEDYYDSYHLLAAYLAVVDTALGQPIPPHSAKE
jgi:hypothetical protein